uniref:RNA-dependent RNA polymerase n=1 Tax=Hubei diptera virus 20 TaxID=1922881 RepID=A0A1L3KP61_9VIRU|nr:RNA-dependent RNA polymerase [Hubei diptera virus 20]
MINRPNLNLTMEHRKITRYYNERTKIYANTTLKRLQQIDEKRNLKDDKTSNLRKVAKKTSYYAELRIKRRDSMRSTIEKWYNVVEQSFDLISYNLCAQSAIINDKVIQDYFTDIFPLIKSYPELVLDLASLVPDPPSEIASCLNHKNLTHPSESVVEDAFVYSPIHEIVLDVKQRYLINMPGHVIRTYLNGDKDKMPSYNHRVNSELFLQLSNQSRWNNIWVQIAASIFYVDNSSPAKGLQNTILEVSNVRRYGRELLTIQTICYLLKQWKMLPFTVRPDGKLDISDSNTSWTTSMIPLIYSLLELSKEEKGNNVTPDFLIPIIKYRIKAAHESFETYTLDHKGVYSSLFKLISMNLHSYARYTYSRNMEQQNLTYHEGNVERFINEEEKQKILKLGLEKADPEFFKVFQSYLMKLNKGSPTQNTELARFLMNVLIIMGNAGIYYKTSLVLEKVQSVESQTLGPLHFPKPTHHIVTNDIKIDFKTNWKSGSPIFKIIEEQYRKDATSVLQVLDETNLQEWFYTLLTNRSQGFKVDVDTFASKLNIQEELIKELRNVGQVRIAAFLLDNDTFSVMDKFVDQLRQDGICTIRFQNNRRARIVEIVPNVDQTAYAIVLAIFEELKAVKEEIAVGKQIGGVVDMSLQLRITGLDKGVSIFSDVKAMDAHTQPDVAVMFLKILSEIISDNNTGPSNYFPFKTMPCHVEHKEDGGLDSSVVEQIKIPSLSQILLFVAANRLNKKYSLKDSIFNCTIQINPTIFESGRFDTSAQHTKLLAYVANHVYDHIKRVLPNLVGKYLYGFRKFGDDSYEFLENSALDKNQLDDLIHQIITLTDESLFQVGLKTETELSAYYGDFLQQLALCGIVVPKSPRSSIYTDERSALVTRDVVDLITNLSNIITASAQRTYSPENVIPIVRTIWAINRVFRLMPSKQMSVCDDLLPYIKQFGNAYYLEYPYIMISLPPLNFPNQTFEFSNGLVLPRSSNLRTVGDCKLNYLWNELFSVEDRKKLFVVKSNLIGDGTLIGVYEFFVNHTRSTHILPSLLLYKFNRSQTLSKKRYEKLEDPIMKMAKIGSNYFNQTMLTLSFTAAANLRSTYGITLPDNLYYYMKPIEQLKDLFHTRSETGDEAVILNDAFIEFTNRNFKNVPKDIKDKIINTCIFWEKTELRCTNYYDEEPNLPIMPGYNIQSDYFQIIQVVGNALRNAQRQNRALVSFTTRYGGSYNMEAILKYGTKARLADINGSGMAFKMFLDAMQLPSRMRDAVIQLFKSDEVLLLHDLYSSGFQPEQMFAISDSVKNIPNFIHHKIRLPPSAVGIINVMYRDYLLMTAHLGSPEYAYTPVLAPETLINYNLRRLLRKVGISAM